MAIRKIVEIGSDKLRKVCKPVEKFDKRLKQLLEASLEKGHISHFYLISGPEGSGKHTLAKLLAAAILVLLPIHKNILQKYHSYAHNPTKA